MHVDNASLRWISGGAYEPASGLPFVSEAALVPAKRLAWLVLRIYLIQAEVGERCTRLRESRSRALAKPGGNTHLQRTEAYE